jgi:hypothetical protein
LKTRQRLGDTRDFGAVITVCCRASGGFAFLESALVSLELRLPKGGGVRWALAFRPLAPCCFRLWFRSNLREAAKQGAHLLGSGRRGHPVVTGDEVRGDGRREADQARFRREGGADNPEFMGKLHRTPRLGAGRREAEGIGGTRRSSD